ncbi:MAG: response regulator transcription factor [Chloroflexota bacterium]
MEEPDVTERILLVDDDKAVLSGLRRALARAGFDVISAQDGETALELALTTKPDAVVLDVKLPGIDGFKVCALLREASSVPILMLTAKDTIPDRVAGLERGADDYLVKPFAVKELLARVRALLRRVHLVRDGCSYAGVVIDERTKEAFRDGQPLKLTALEYALLVAFIRHPRQAFSRDQLCRMAWGYPYRGESNFIDVAVTGLRRKLDAGGRPRLLQTLRSHGYALKET